MNGLLVQVEYRGAVPSRMRSVLRAANKAAFLEIGELWHKVMRPKHFTEEGARKYGYQKRKGEGESGRAFWRSYTGRKMRKFGHTRPLEWSGLSKTLTAMRDVRATSTGARVVMRANALNFRNPHSTINMRDELTRITPDEGELLIRKFDGRLHRIMNADTGRARRRLM